MPLKFSSEISMFFSRVDALGGSLVQDKSGSEWLQCSCSAAVA